ncbi:MAG: trypsin-like peptidase domain-containing protein [Acidobacteria bacterium]|nr:trypsin-like peptidase domain-containing protein [Acidobacteriota bacterium]
MRNRITFNGNGDYANCTGTLINNTANNCKQYVLTAEHCVLNAGAVAGSYLIFNYERPGCCEGNLSTDQQASGALLRAIWADTDMALLEITGTISSTFNARFNGWSRSNNPGGPVGVIHIPAGGEPKKVSVDNDGPTAETDFWRVADYEIGITKDGSSGAPLFNNDGRVIGQLSAGVIPDNCQDQALNDIYGRFDRSWKGGGSAGTRLKDWLDPANTNKISHPGKEVPHPLLPCGSSIYPRFRIGFSHDDVGNRDGIVDPGEKFGL